LSIILVTDGKVLRRTRDFEDIGLGSIKVGSNLAAEKVRTAEIFFATVLQ
jgi:hypothetical protein